MKPIDLPENVIHVLSLPAHTQDIYWEAFNHAWREYASPEERYDNASQEETTHKLAWTAMKKKYKKPGDE
ncbi:MAG: ChaB family protein [Nitrosomonas sp.]|nr:ChaB family protein [Nitrosomonas sp.]